MSRFIRGMLPPNPSREDAENHMLSPRTGGSTMWHPMHQFSQYGEKKVSNTTVEIDLKGDGVGSTVLGANYLSYRGKMFTTMTMGYWEKKFTATTLHLRVRLATINAVPVVMNNVGSNTVDVIYLPNHNITVASAINMDCTFQSLSAGTGLVNGTTYFVIYVDVNNFRVSATRTLTNKLVQTTGAPVDILANGTGAVLFSTIIHQRLFEGQRFTDGGGHFEISTMTTVMTTGTTGTINMHGDLVMKESDSAELVGVHTENLILGVDTTVPIMVITSAQWSIADSRNHITSTNYMIE